MKSTTILVAAIVAANTVQAESDISDGTAFNLWFLSYVEELETDREAGTHYIADSFKLPHDEAGNLTPEAKRATERLADVFWKLGQRYRGEYAQTEYDILCRIGPEATDDDRYRALYSLSDAREAVGTKYYRILTAQINGELGDAVMNDFHRRKEGMWVGEPTDYRVDYPAAGIDPAEVIAQICADLVGKGVRQ